MRLLNKIHGFLQSIGCSEEEIDTYDSSSVYIAEEIALYAHRNQKRLNGEMYFRHPHRVLQRYRNFVGITEHDYFCVDVDLLAECNLPYNGVQEVCLLHDVLEDTTIAVEEIEEIFDYFSLDEFFKNSVKQPLLLVTHRPEDNYSDYIRKLLRNPVASMVKFMDMADNMDPSTLNVFGNKELERIQKYAAYAQLINSQWHFLENVIRYFQLYRKDLNH
ncbi:MAG: hypothetical protein SPH68_05395 [Candidatus Borkfalkiaceae bacterium]|nr:hypothetical protein [Clostridia bacterium]MDY6223575.1 hypothetical protein [Christensenellaceae bacterium]